MILIFRIICIATLSILMACASAPRAADREAANISDNVRADKATAQRAADYAQSHIDMAAIRQADSTAAGWCNTVIRAPD